MGYHIIILKVTIMAKQLVKFMNERLQREMDKLWESGEMSNEKLQKMQSEHLRTTYKLTDKWSISITIKMLFFQA